MGSLCTGGDNKYKYNLVDSSMQKNTVSTRLIVEEQEANVVELNMNNSLQKVSIPFTLVRNLEIGALITLGKERYMNMNSNLIIFIMKQKSLSCLPLKTVICFRSQ